MKRNRIAALGLALALVVPGSALAATTGQVAESISVSGTLALTLSKSTINYGSVIPGANIAEAEAAAPVADRTVGIEITGNSNWSLAITGTPFSGPGSLPASARTVQLNSPNDTREALPRTITGAPGTYTDNAIFLVRPPAGTQAGAYTGTVTFTVTGS